MEQAIFQNFKIAGSEKTKDELSNIFIFDSSKFIFRKYKS